MPTIADPLAGIAEGDPGRRRALRQALERLATGAAGPRLQEMAGEILSGRAGFRAAVASGHYQEALGERVATFLRWRAEQSPEQLAEQMAVAQRYLDEQRALAGQERAAEDSAWGQ